MTEDASKPTTTNTPAENSSEHIEEYSEDAERLNNHNLQEVFDWLYGRQYFGIRLGLERVQHLLARVSNPQQCFRSILVGGTNGKGTTAAHLAAMLQAAGHNTALYTSPHLTHFAERFVVNNQPLDEEVLAHSILELKPHAEDLDASFFEVLTALACLVFAKVGVEWAVMEVGLGGRWDATNALEPELSIISSIGLDHTEWLGQTLEAIASEKAGILRPHHPAVVALHPKQNPELLNIFRQTRADIWALELDIQLDITSLAWQGSQLDLELPTGQNLQLTTPLLGEHSARNAALAAAAAARLGLSNQHIASGAARVQWSGRLEVIERDEQRFLLDGAHNADGARALAKALAGLDCPSLPMVFGASSGKDLSSIASTLTPRASWVVLTKSQLSPRSAEPETIAPLFTNLPMVLTHTPQQALEAVAHEPQVLVCGSLYLVGEIRLLLLGNRSEGRLRMQ